jgi:hypothetical protein
VVDETDQESQGQIVAALEERSGDPPDLPSRPITHRGARDRMNPSVDDRLASIIRSLT